MDKIKLIRTIIRDLGWEEFMMHVGSIMAEQVDKLPTDEQNTENFNMSNLIHSLRPFYKRMGCLDYKDSFSNGCCIEDLELES